MKRLFLLLAILACPAFLFADTVSLSNITASWTNGMPASAPTYYLNGTSSPTVTWGVGVSGDPSGYTFTAIGSDIAVDVDEGFSDAFKIGTFTHHNNPIRADSGPFLSSVSLALNMDIWINGAFQGLQTFIFDFSHWETDNNPLWGVCANGLPNYSGVNINGCADNVSLSSNSWENVFSVGGSDYTVGLYGFIQGQDIVNNWWTIERADNNADLMGYVGVHKVPSEVPEPASAALLISGLGVLGVISRKK